jgi:hypothetical protein
MEVREEEPRGGGREWIWRNAIRLSGQVLEWAYGYFDDRSGSEKLTQ